MQLLEDPQTRGFARAAMAAGVEKRIEYLDLADHKLLEVTLSGKLSRREAGMLVGLSSGTVTRRIRKLINRLHDPMVAALVDGGKLLPELHQEVGLAYFLRKRPMRRIGVEYGIPICEVKRIVAYVRGWHAASKRRC
jgi:hypothetical protein